MTEYIDNIRGLLIRIKEFEEQYVHPYIVQRNKLIEDGGTVSNKIEGHVSALTGLVHAMREHIEITTVREILILSLKEELEKQRVLRGGKLKLMMKDQMETILPILEQLITTDR